VRLDALVVGNTAGVLHGAAVMTNDVDLFVRDTKSGRVKLKKLAALLGGAGPMKLSELSDVERIYGAAVPVDVLFERIAGPLTFASVRSRARAIPVGAEALVVASLGDVIRSKEAANRPKDRAALPALRAALVVQRAREALEE
jgi:hypothetical protein